MRIGFDIGGTKIAAIALDDDGREIARRREPVPHAYEGVVLAIEKTVALLVSGGGAPQSVGICMPGVISADGDLHRVVNLPWLEGRPLATDLASSLGCKVRIANDANCFALSEATDGAAAGAGVVFGVILGTGVGGGIVVDRRVVVGANAGAGEWGHNPLPWRCDTDGREVTCACGRLGCIETWLNGRALARIYRDEGGAELDAAEVGERAQRGDAAATRALARYRSLLARALSGVVNFLDPDVIVLGGGLSSLPGLYEDMPPEIGKWSHYPDLRTRLVQAKFGPESGMRGAAWL